jgi:SAM-dependent methyltransferase
LDGLERAVRAFLALSVLMGVNVMTPEELSKRDHAEVERSAAEASRVILTPVDVDRYLDPPGDTPYGLEYAFHLLGEVEGKTVLDLGCGTGETLIPLVKRGAKVIAMDISPELVALARRRLEFQTSPWTWFSRWLCFTISTWKKLGRRSAESCVPEVGSFCGSRFASPAR